MSLTLLDHCLYADWSVERWEPSLVCCGLYNFVLIWFNLCSNISVNCWVRDFVLLVCVLWCSHFVKKFINSLLNWQPCNAVFNV